VQSECFRNDDGAPYPVLEAVGEPGVLDAPVTFRARGARDL